MNREEAIEVLCSVLEDIMPHNDEIIKESNEMRLSLFNLEIESARIGVKYDAPPNTENIIDVIAERLKASVDKINNSTKKLKGKDRNVVKTAINVLRGE